MPMGYLESPVTVAACLWTGRVPECHVRLGNHANFTQKAVRRGCELPHHCIVPADNQISVYQWKVGYAHQKGSAVNKWNQWINYLHTLKIASCANKE